MHCGDGARRNAPPKAIRVLIGALAAHEKWAQLDAKGRKAATEAARRANNDRWLKLATDQHPEAAESELARIAGNMKAAHFKRMALRSAQSRRRRAGGGPDAG